MRLFFYPCVSTHVPSKDEPIRPCPAQHKRANTSPHHSVISAIDFFAAETSSHTRIILSCTYLYNILYFLWCWHLSVTAISATCPTVGVFVCMSAFVCSFVYTSRFLYGIHHPHGYNIRARRGVAKKLFRQHKTPLVRYPTLAARVKFNGHSNCSITTGNYYDWLAEIGGGVVGEQERERGREWGRGRQGASECGRAT